MRAPSPRSSFRALLARTLRMAPPTPTSPATQLPGYLIALFLVPCTSFLVPQAHAQWTDLATISNTLGNTAGRLCVGAGRTDLGCPVNAPLLSDSGLLTVPGDLRIIGNLLVSGTQSFDGVTFANGGVSATGAITATSFAGDGSGLTGINFSANPIDRIVSGSAAVIAEQGGTVGLTLGGTPNAAYIHPTLGFVGPGVSTTGTISGTDGHFNRVKIGDIANLGGINYGLLTIKQSTNNNAGGLAIVRATGTASGRIFIDNSDTLHITRATTNETLAFTTTGRMGVGTSTPATTLHVSGTLRIANGGEACTAGLTGAIKYDSDQFQVCRNGTAWETLVAGASGSMDTDRITSGTTSVITNNDASVTLSTAGTERMVIGTNGNIGIGTNTPNYTLDLVNPNATVALRGTETALRLISNAGRQLYFGASDISNTQWLGTQSNHPLFIITANSSRMAVTSNGNVNIANNLAIGQGAGNSSPAMTRLDVSGTLRIANGGESCDANRTGAIKYDSGQFQICRNGTAWETLVAGASGTVDTDRITSGTLAITANTSGNTVSLTTAGTTWGYLGANASYIPNLVSNAISATNISATTLNGLTVSEIVSSAADNLGNHTATQDLNMASFNITDAGTVNGTFVGDGSGLTNIPAAAVTGLNLDRITSGTTAVVANTEGNTISFTQAGTTTAYLNNGQLVAASVSTTGPVSATWGMFNKAVIGNVYDVSSSGMTYGALTIKQTDNTSSGGLAIVRNAHTASGRIYVDEANTLRITRATAAETLAFTTTGRMGVGTSFPSTTLHVAGSVRVGYEDIICNTDRAGAIRYNTGVFEFCSGSSWQSLSAAAASQSDRITSGTTAVVANTEGNTISFTQAGITTAYLNNGQLVAASVSTTGTISGTTVATPRLALQTVSGGNGISLSIAGADNLGNHTATQNLDMASFNITNAGNVNGTFVGDGSGLTNISAAAVTGLNLDRITSGTTAVVANTEGNTVSLTTAGTTWGYLGANASYIPNLVSNAISATNISATTLNGLTVSEIVSSAADNLGNHTATQDLNMASFNITDAGTVNGTFVGDGSGLTNIPAAAVTGLNLDRITSGTTAVVANTEGNTISLTTAGTTWGYLGSSQSYIPNLVSNAISATNISATTLNGLTVSEIVSSAADNLGNHTAIQNLNLGTNYLTHDGTDSGIFFDTGGGIKIRKGPIATSATLAPSSDSALSILEAGGKAEIYTGWAEVGAGLQAALVPTLTFAGRTSTTIYAWSGSTQFTYNGDAFVIKHNGGPTAGIGQGPRAVAIGTDGNENDIRISGGNVTISNSLSLGGHIRISNTSVTCDVDRTGAIRYTSGEFYVCRNGTEWESLTSIANSAASAVDRITSGTLAVVANTEGNTISLTTAGTTWGYLGSAASYLPQINATNVSSTNVTANLLQLNTVSGGSGVSLSIAGADNLGNHTATQNLDMASFNITNAGNVAASGSLKAGNADTVCSGSDSYGKMRFNTATGKMILCRP